MKLLDTCFLIDLQREAWKNRTGIAVEFLKQNASVPLAISVISATEFLEGFESFEKGEVFLRPFQWIAIDSRISKEAAKIRRFLRLSGKMIGDFDILIAATALIYEATLVTQNASDFDRIQDLKIETYR